MLKRLHRGVPVVFVVLLLPCLAWAQAGDPSAYEDTSPDGTPEERAAIYDALSTAAEAGDPQAQYEFGELNEDWKAAYHDYPTTLKWYKAAALQGHLAAQHRLGYMYRRRVYVDTDFHEAIKWYTMAARQGHAESMSSLGHMYDHAEDFYETQDYVNAYHWFNLAIKLGDKPAVRNQERITKWMTPEQIEQANARTEAWIKKYGLEKAVIVKKTLKAN
jgi:uncharacterized protein